MIYRLQRQDVRVDFGDTGNDLLPYTNVVGKSLGDLWLPNSFVHGSLGNDTLRMTDFAEQIAGGEGHDIIEGRGGRDFIDVTDTSARVI
jgi:Ca2+-binding RTX toxin-like protein